jgi:hypothetical protein
MVSGAPKPGGNRLNPAGGHRAPNAGGISFANGNWRAFQGHVSADFPGPITASGARVIQTRRVTNPRRDAKTTGVTYLWTLPTRPGGSTATVSNGTTATVSYTPDMAGTFVLRCVVTFTGSGRTVTQDHTYVSA